MPGTRSDPHRVLALLSAYSSAAVTAGLNVEEFVVPFPCRLGGIQATAVTAGTGAGNTVLDILNGGTSVYVTTANRPTLAATSTGAFACSAPEKRAVQVGDRLTLQAASISSTGHARLAFTVALEAP